MLTGRDGRGSRAEGATGRPAAMMVRSAGWWRCRACSGLISDQVARRGTGRRGGAGARVLAAQDVAEGRVRGGAELLRH